MRWKYHSAMCGSHRSWWNHRNHGEPHQNTHGLAFNFTHEKTVQRRRKSAMSRQTSVHAVVRGHNQSFRQVVVEIYVFLLMSLRKYYLNNDARIWLSTVPCSAWDKWHMRSTDIAFEPWSSSCTSFRRLSQAGMHMITHNACKSVFPRPKKSPYTHTCAYVYAYVDIQIYVDTRGPFMRAPWKANNCACMHAFA
jgi:hypothetical protein